MKITKSFSLAAAATLGMLPPANAGGGAKTPIPEPRGRWELHAGFGIRQSFDVNVRSSSRSLLGGAFSPVTGNSSLYAGIGPVDAEADRVYDDGFVNIGSLFNLTSHWGYQDTSQIGQSSQQWDPSQPWDSPGNQSLYLASSGQTGIAGYHSSADSDQEFFPYIEARRWWDCDQDSFWTEKGFVASWSWIPADAGLTENLAVQRNRVVDEYYLYGVIVPSAPYTGPPLPPGPLLDNIPHSREESNGASTAVATTRADVSLDLNTLSFGGIWRYAPKDDRSEFDSIGLYGLDLQAGVSVNFARLKLRSETSVIEEGQLIGSFQDSASNSKLLPGLYLSLGATFDVGEEENWMIFTQGRYDYVGDINVRAGLSSAHVDLEGFSATIGIGRRW
jgi:hypothetical protein